jgi:hypothetical protein
VPEVVLIGERYEIGIPRYEPEAALEVSVEPEATRGARTEKPRIVCDDFLDPIPHVARRAVVGHDADERLMTLLANRFDLPEEQVGAWLIGGKADADERFLPLRRRSRKLQRVIGNSNGHVPLVDVVGARRTKRGANPMRPRSEAEIGSQHRLETPTDARSSDDCVTQRHIDLPTELFKASTLDEHQRLGPMNELRRIDTIYLDCDLPDTFEWIANQSSLQIASL